MKWQSKISMLSSNEPSANEYQPSGTFIAALGPWTSWVWQVASNSTELGRWLYLTFQLKDDRKLHIISGYHICKQDPTLGSCTCYNQQLWLLMAAGHVNLNPQKQLFLNLTQQVKTWRTQHHEVLICLDLNKDTSKLNPTEDLSYLLSQMDLVDLHRHWHPTLPMPATHQRGILTINAILGSPQVTQAVIGAFYLPYGEPITLSGNHRTLSIDLDATFLFGTWIPAALFTFHHSNPSESQLPLASLHSCTPHTTTRNPPQPNLPDLPSSMDKEKQCWPRPRNTCTHPA